MLRDKGFRRTVFLLGLVGAGGALVLYFLNEPVCYLWLLFSALSIAVFIGSTAHRYREIGALSAYLRRISEGDFTLDLRDNKEGELSILKNEIYKVTAVLSTQAQALGKDKRTLADAVSDISHQLKTPLTSLYVMTDLLSQPDLPDDRRAEFAHNIRSQLERIEWLVTSLLKLSKLDAGAVEFKREVMPVKAVVDKAVQPLLIPIEIKEQTLQIEGDERARFTGDLNWTAEALLNVLKNCIEHTPERGVIRIRYGDNPLFAEITVEDNGAGIDRADLPYIFKRFYKGRGAHADSVGIGLAMSQSILEGCGGSISVRSQPGAGTQFCIRLRHGG